MIHDFEPGACEDPTLTVGGWDPRLRVQLEDIPNDMLGWLRMVLGERQRLARRALSQPWHTATDAPWENALVMAEKAPESLLTPFLALHNPQAEIHRIRAEWEILAMHGNDGKGYCNSCGPTPQPCETVRWLVYAHRFDAPGWRMDWAPYIEEVM